MSDEVVKIRIEAVDQNTLGQMEKNLKAMRLALKDINTSTPEFLKQRQAVDDLAKSIDLLKGGVGALHRSYFEQGEVLRTMAIKEKGFTEILRESRQERRLGMYATRELSQAMATVIGVQGGAFANALQAGASGAFAMKLGLDAVGGSLAALSAPIAAAIFAYAVLTKAFADNSGEARKNVEELRKLTDTIMKLKLEAGEIGEATYRTYLRGRLLGIQAELLKEQAKPGAATFHPGAFTGALPTGVGMGLQAGVAAYNAMSETQDLKKIKDLEAQRLAIKIELAKEDVKASDVYIKQAEATQKIAVATGKIKENLQASSPLMDEAIAMFYNMPSPGSAEYDAAQTRLRAISQLGNKREGGFSKSFVAPQGNLGGGGMMQRLLYTDQGGNTKEEMKGDLKELVVLTGPLTSGINSVGAAISTQIVDKLGQANSVLQIFIQGLATAAASLAANLATTALIAVIGSAVGLGPFAAIFGKLMHFDQGGLIPEPVAGIGLRSGRPYSFAERGPEYVVNPNNIMPTHPQVQKIYVVGEFKQINGRVLGATIRQDTNYDGNRAF